MRINNYYQDQHLRDSFLQVRVQLGEVLQVGLGEETSICGPGTL